MGNAYLWIKALHVVFVVSWFAGLFCLPRIYVNLAMVGDAATRERLLLRARKLLRFMTPAGAVRDAMSGSADSMRYRCCC